MQIFWNTALFKFSFTRSLHRPRCPNHNDRTTRQTPYSGSS